jgi:hypothetical protein
MKPRHPKYNIKPTDTLQSITKLFNKEENVWKQYHNNLCRPPEELIREQLPTHLTEIYLLPELWEKEYEFNKPIEKEKEKQAENIAPVKKPRHPKYKIKPTDTLPSITELFGKEEDVWKQYHNNMCRPLDELIREQMPKTLTEIYLLPELWEKEDELNKLAENEEKRKKRENTKISFGYQNTLLMSQCPDKMMYKVAILIESEGKKTLIEYDTSVRWIKQEELTHIIEINRLPDTYKINKVAPDLVAEELGIKAGTVLYPLQLIVTRQDRVIGIHNVKEIQERWNKVKEDILYYNEGETIEEYLDLTEQSLQSEETLLACLKNDWFFHTYFNRIYQTYTESYSATDIISTPFEFDEKSVEYQTQVTLDKEVNEDALINIALTGTVKPMEDTPSLVSIGEYKARYLLEPQFNTIEKATLSTTFYSEPQEKVDVQLTKIKK